MSVELLPKETDSEWAVVGFVLRYGADAFVQLDGLRPRHLAEGRLRLILEAARELMRRGEPATLPAVVGRLRDVGKLDAAGGHTFVSEVETDAGSPEMIPVHLRRLRQAAARRLLATIGNSIYSLQIGHDLEPEEALRRAEALSSRAGVVASVALQSHRTQDHCLKADQLLSIPFPPIRWAVSGEGRLLIPQGTVGSLFGWGGVGKSLQAMEMAICHAAGIPWLGAFGTRQCSVLYVDFELPQAMLQDRLRWLLAAMGVDARDLPLFLWSAQGFLLGPERSVELERRIRVTGARLVMIDSITMATLWDEMDAVVVTKTFRNALYPIRDKGIGLTLVDHSRKPGNDQTSTGASVHDMRGTTAKINCLDWAIGLQHRKDGEDERLVFSCAKQRYGPFWSPFSARLEPVFPEGRRSVFDRDYQPGQTHGDKSTAISDAIRWELQERPGQLQSSMVGALVAGGHKERTIEDVMSDMVERGELEKAPDPTDGRRNILSLVKKEPGV